MAKDNITIEDTRKVFNTKLKHDSDSRKDFNEAGINHSDSDTLVQQDNTADEIENSPETVNMENNKTTVEGSGASGEPEDIKDEGDDIDTTEEDVDPNDPDNADLFKMKKLKKIVSCTVNKFRPKDEDKVPYGIDFDDDEVRSGKMDYEISGNTLVSTHSLKRSLERPVSVERNEVPVSTKDKHLSNRNIPDPYPCQTNAQIHPDPRRQKTSVCMDDDQYDFSHPKRGYMVAIVNDRFRMQQKRDGAHWDLLKIKEISRKLGFRHFNYGKERNLTKQETLNLLRSVQQADHSSCDCFLFMISTHGLEQPNPRAKGKPDHALVCADDQLIFTSTILEMFNDDNCPSLKNKPKWFIIQACRGDNLDHGADVFVAYPKRTVDSADVTNVEMLNLSKEESCQAKEKFRRKKPSIDEIDTKPGPGNWTLPIPQPSYCVPRVNQSGSVPPAVPRVSSRYISRVYAPTPYAIVDTPSLRCDNDMVVMYAIPEGMFAWRNTSDGSWMIDYLHQVIMAYDMRRPKNLLSLLTKVSSLMSMRSTNTPSTQRLHMKKAIPVIENKLLKDVIFTQKVQGSSWVKPSIGY